jgi:hypothetical protein
MKNILTVIQRYRNMKQMYIIKRMRIQEYWLFITNLLC